MTIGVGDKLFGLGGEHRANELRVDPAQAATQPHVEEVGEIGVADVVVVRRIRGHHESRVVALRRADLGGDTFGNSRGVLDSFCYPLDLPEEVAR